MIEASIKLDQIWFDFCRENNGQQIGVVLVPVEIGVMFPYMSARVWWSFQDTFSALISILVYTPSKRFSRSFFMVQVSAPYNRILYTEARKNASLVSLEILDFHIRCSLLQADQASALPVLKPFSLSLIYDPRYLKSSTVFRDVPFKVWISFLVDSSFSNIRSVLVLFSVKPTLFVRHSSDWSSTQRFLSGQIVKQYYLHSLSL